MNRTLRFVLAATAMFGTCYAAPDTVEPLARIPVDLVHGLPTTTVLVDGVPLRLYLDFGSYRDISLTTDELRRVKVSYLESETSFRNAEGDALKSRNFVAHHVSVSGYDFGDVHGGEAAFGGMAPPDQNGNLGMALLGRYLLVLDYPHSQVRIYPAGDRRAFDAECGARSFPVNVERGIATSVIRTQFGARKVIWDTGATDNFIRPTALPAQLRQGRAIDDGPPVVQLQKVSIGSLDVGPQPFRLWAFKAPDVDAYLGTTLFRTRKVCLDLKARKGGIGPRLR